MSKLIEALNIKQKIIWFDTLKWSFNSQENLSDEAKEQYAKLTYLYLKLKIGYVDKDEANQILKELELGLYAKDEQSNGNLISLDIFKNGLVNAGGFPNFVVNDKIKRPGDFNCTSDMINMFKKVSNTEFIKNLSFEDWFKDDRNLKKLFDPNTATINFFKELATFYKVGNDDLNKAVNNYYQSVKIKLSNANFWGKKDLKIFLAFMDYVEDDKLVNFILKNKSLKSFESFISLAPKFQKYIDEKKDGFEILEKKLSEIKELESDDRKDIYVKDNGYITLSIDILLATKLFKCSNFYVGDRVFKFTKILSSSEIANVMVDENEHLIRLFIIPKKNAFSKIEEQYEAIIKKILNKVLSGDIELIEVKEVFDVYKEEEIMKKNIVVKNKSSNIKKF